MHRILILRATLSWQQKIGIYTGGGIAIAASSGTVINGLENLKIQATMWFGQFLHSLLSSFVAHYIDQHCNTLYLSLCVFEHTCYQLYFHDQLMNHYLKGYIIILESNSGVKYGQCSCSRVTLFPSSVKQSYANIGWRTICIALDHGYFPSTSFFWLTSPPLNFSNF